MATEENRRRTKVERLIDEYGLDAWGDRLEAKWLGERGERRSLRELAREFNVAVLDATLREAGHSPIDADLRSTYRTLSDEDVPRADEVRKRRQLERDGVDVDALRSDFVTHQAVHTYLTRVRDAELDRDDGDTVERRRETIQRLEGRTGVVTESALEDLVEADVLRDREYEVLVSVTVVCDDCGADYTVTELFESGGCDCEREGNREP